jgi:hypothetical protein
MKRIGKMIGIVAMAALIGFTMLGCGDDPAGGDNGNGGNGDPLQFPSGMVGSWVHPTDSNLELIIYNNPVLFQFYNNTTGKVGENFIYISSITGNDYLLYNESDLGYTFLLKLSEDGTTLSFRYFDGDPQYKPFNLNIDSLAIYTKLP